LLSIKDREKTKVPCLSISLWNPAKKDAVDVGRSRLLPSGLKEDKDHTGGGNRILPKNGLSSLETDNNKKTDRKTDRRHFS